MYRYRCGQCRTTSPVVRTWVEVLHERDRHRRLMHGGHVPDGERLQRYRGRREMRPRMVIAVLLGLLLLALITHH